MFPFVLQQFDCNWWNLFLLCFSFLFILVNWFLFETKCLEIKLIWVQKSDLWISNPRTRASIGLGWISNNANYLDFLSFSFSFFFAQDSLLLGAEFSYFLFLLWNYFCRLQLPTTYCVTGCSFFSTIILVVRLFV